MTKFALVPVEPTEEMRFKKMNISRIRQLFRYEGGRLIRRGSCSTASAGDVAGSRRYDGYREVSIDNVSFREHRVIWALVYGEQPIEIDHINGVRSDNRIENLRGVSRSQNQQNKVASLRKSSPYKGVHYSKQRKRWISKIKKNGKVKHIGSYGDEIAAAKAYDCVAYEQYGEFARPNFPISEGEG